MNTDSAETPTKLCEHCLLVKPLKDFRRRSAGNDDDRMTQCRQYHNKRERERRGRQRERRDQRQMGRFVTEVKNARTSARLEWLCTEMVTFFGGMDWIANAFKSYYDRVSQTGSFAAVRCLQAVVQMVKYVDERQPSLDDMTDDELKAQLTSILAADPTVVESILTPRGPCNSQ